MFFALNGRYPKPDDIVIYAPYMPFYTTAPMPDFPNKKKK